jgi:DNA-binding XRE family transcriptional regulator
MEKLTKNPKLNARWLETQLELNDMSQRDLAKLLKLQPTAITRLRVGTRRLRMEEAMELSRLFQVPLEEVLFNAGLKAKDQPTSKEREQLEVSGWIDIDLTLHDGKVPGPKFVPNPLHELGEGVKVYRAQTIGSPYAMIDGALVYFKPHGDTIHPDALGRLCIVSIASEGLDEGSALKLRFVSRGYQSGAFNLAGFNGMPIPGESDVKLLHAWPILWMRL